MNNEHIVVGVKYTPSTIIFLDLNDIAKRIEQSNNFDLIEVLEGIYLFVKPQLFDFELKIRADGNIVIYSFIDSDKMHLNCFEEYQRLIKESKKIVRSLQREKILTFKFQQSLQLACHELNRYPYNTDELISSISDNFNILTKEDIYSRNNNIIVTIRPMGGKLHY